jgi:hypothetical protein
VRCSHDDRWSDSLDPHREASARPVHGCDVTELGYEIRVAGLVPDAVLDELHDARVVIAPAATVLRGPIADQAALHAMISRLQGMGLELVEVRRITQLQLRDTR